MDYDVIVVGGGNTHFPGAILRVIYNDPSELDRFVPDAELDRRALRCAGHGVTLCAS